MDLANYFRACSIHHSPAVMPAHRSIERSF